MATTSLSKKLETSINRFFSPFVIPNETVYNENIMYGGIMNKFIAIDKSSNKEIPTCCFRETLSSTIAYNNTVLYIPLHEIANRKSYKTAHMIFNNLVVQPSRAGTLQRIRTSSGKVYYGSYGLLLDENKNPILLSTVNVKRTGTPYYNVSDLTLYVNPSVFTETDIINSLIKDKIIPFILSEGVSFNTEIRDSHVKDNIERKFIGLNRKAIPKIVIDSSINKFFITPVETLQNPSNVILSNIDDFIDFVNG